MCFWFAETHNAIILVLQLGCLPIGKKADFFFFLLFPRQTLKLWVFLQTHQTVIDAMGWRPT